MRQSTSEFADLSQSEILLASLKEKKAIEEIKRDELTIRQNFEKKLADARKREDDFLNVPTKQTKGRGKTGDSMVLDKQKMDDKK